MEEEHLEEKETNNNMLNKQKNQPKPQQHDLFIINPLFFIRECKRLDCQYLLVTNGFYQNRSELRCN